ncbi:MAG: ferritin family protein [Anaerohalosphaeraceae bacterium]
MATHSIQDILNYAIRQEDEANGFYLRLAQQVEKDEVRSALKKFALDEFQHKIHLEGVRDGEVDFKDEEVGSLGIASSIPEIKPRVEMSYKELLALAIRNEHKAFTLYSQLAQAAKNPAVRELFEHLAQEEARHKIGLEIEFDLIMF